MLFTPPSVPNEIQLSKLTEMLHLSADDFTHNAQTLSSADELSVYVMRLLMRQFAPSLLWITLHDIGVAHTGAYSLYIEAFAGPTGCARRYGR